MRFCGMCGGTLLAPPSAHPARPDRGAAPVREASAPSTATATRPPEEPRTPPRTSESSPGISGPSFLGLSEAPPSSRKRADLGIEPHGRSRNLDYLLEDDERHHGGGAGKFFLIVLALLLAVGFGYLRWKNQLPWLTAGGTKPAAATQTAEQPAPETATNSAPPVSPSITPEPQPAPTQPAANPPAAQATTSQPAPAATTNPPATPDLGAAKTDSGGVPESAAPQKTPPADAAATQTTAPAAKPQDTEDNGDSTAPAAAADKAKIPPAPAAKPRPVSKPADPVAEAQRYLYGKGAAQDCDHGMRILRPLANQGNTKAMVEMGALYSAGLCAPHDLPTSYRWFAMALRKDPSNQAIQTDLSKLWGEMTQPERQLAIKLTQ